MNSMRSCTKSRRSPPFIKIAVVVSLYYCSGFLIFLITDAINLVAVYDETTRKNSVSSYAKDVVQPYDKEAVLNTQLKFNKETANSLLIFDSETGIFHAYYDERIKSHRHFNMARMMAHSLYKHFPERFIVGAPPVQLLFSAEDYPTLRLPLDLTPAEKESGEKFAPVLQFGSVPRNDDADNKLLDPIQMIQMPFAKVKGCISREMFRTCFLDDEFISSLLDPQLRQQNAIPWEELTPQIIWRGSKYQFLERFNLGYRYGNQITTIDYSTPQSFVRSLLDTEGGVLNPRWRAVALSLQAFLDIRQQLHGVDGDELPWIDAKFFHKVPDPRFERFQQDAGVFMSTNDFIPYEQQATYKYHIDIGGAGGTSWTATLSKLAMPGLLFHHESVMKDFYFDDIKPWVHYIPIKMDLSDLREKFEWAEAHPVEAKAISEAATDFIRKFKSDEYMKNVYEKYFVQRLGEVVNAYRPSEDVEVEMSQNVLREYESKGIHLTELCTCDKETCDNNAVVFSQTA